MQHVVHEARNNKRLAQLELLIYHSSGVAIVEQLEL